MAMTTQPKSSLSIRSATALEGVLEADAEAVLDERAAQLARHRLVALLDDRVHGLGHREARREAAGHQGQRLGELGTERREATAVLELEVDDRQDRSGRECEHQQHAAAEHEAEQAGRHGDPGVQQDPLGRREGDARGVEALGQPGLEVALDQGSR